MGVLEATKKIYEWMSQIQVLSPPWGIKYFPNTEEDGLHKEQTQSQYELKNRPDLDVGQSLASPSTSQSLYNSRQAGLMKICTRKTKTKREMNMEKTQGLFRSLVLTGLEVSSLPKSKKINQINLRHSLGHLSEAEKVFGSTNCQIPV